MGNYICGDRIPAAHHGSDRNVRRRSFPMGSQIGSFDERRHSTFRLEETILNLNDLDRRGALGVVVRNLVDAGAHGEAAHGFRVERSEQADDLIDILHGRIEPAIIVLGCDDHRHPVVQIGEQFIWCGLTLAVA
jgi:hypothetical protein